MSEPLGWNVYVERGDQFGPVPGAPTEYVGFVPNSSVVTVAEFLTARLDEDEAAARESYYEGQRWLTEEEGVYRWPADELVHMADTKTDARHIARWDPARVLREVEAKRKIVARIERDSASIPFGHRFDFAQMALCELATAYSDHPDYQQEWALEGPPEHD